MAASKKSQEQKEKGKKSDQPSTTKKLGVIIFMVIIVVAIAGALVYGLNRSSQTQTSITVFENNFNAAPKVAILVTAFNATTLASSTGCATALIEELTATHGSAHKNASDISFYVINSTKCLYAPQLGLGQTYLNSTPAGCVNMSRSVPSIFINYSKTNSTVITPEALYVSGTGALLTQCGVASEITAT